MIFSRCFLQEMLTIYHQNFKKYFLSDIWDVPKQELGAGATLLEAEPAQAGAGVRCSATQDVPQQPHLCNVPLAREMPSAAPRFNPEYTDLPTPRPHHRPWWTNQDSGPGVA